MVRHSNRLHFDRDAAFALKSHTVEVLRLHFSHLDRSGQLKQTISKRGLAVIDVRRDDEISDLRCVT